MSVRFKLTDKDDNPLDPIDEVQGAICWGFLKDMKRRISDAHKGVERYNNALPFEQRNYFPADHQTGTVNYQGVPIDLTDKITHLRVYAPENRGDASYLDIGTLYNEVLIEVPVWFKDFTYKEDEEGKGYLLLPLDTSSLRNYNALRMIRNLLLVQYTKVANPMDAVIISDLYLHVGDPKIYTNDGLCVPASLIGTYETIFAVIERGPLLENDDVSLGSMDAATYRNKYGNRYMNRAFLDDIEDTKASNEEAAIRLDKADPILLSQIKVKLKKRRAA